MPTSAKPKFTSSQIKEQQKRIQAEIDKQKRNKKQDHFTSITPEEIEKKAQTRQLAYHCVPRLELDQSWRYGQLQPWDLNPDPRRPSGFSRTSGSALAIDRPPEHFS